MQIKKLIGKLDRILLGGLLTRLYVAQRENKWVKYQTQYFNYGFNVQYQKNDSSSLNIFADRYGSDKGEVQPDSNPYKWPSHNYADFYSLAFGLRRNDVKNKKLNFPTANIIGCDIDSDILFSEERIKTFYCDQTSTNSINNFLKKAEIIKDSVDIIIDDGLHEYYAGVCFFENMVGCLRSDGIYIIEDVSHSDIVKYKKYFCENSASFDA